MKTLVKTLFIPALATVVLSCAAFAAGPDKGPLSIDFNKIVIRGNARVELVQSSKQNVAMYDDASTSNTTILRKGDKLLINSNEAEPANIIVFVKELLRIDAANTVTVVTRGKFSSTALQVFLKDSARAYVNAETESLYTVIKDRSNLKLKGSSGDHILARGKAAKLNVEQFAALKLTEATLDGRILASN